MKVSQLYIYPIKSLGGIALSSVNIAEKGFEYDRRWMLIDDNGRFISQREVAEMSLLKVALSPDGIIVHHSSNEADILQISFETTATENISVQVWDDICISNPVSKEADSWFSQKLNTSCRLVCMKESFKRLLDPKYNINDSITGFADGFPVLLISEASLDDLNQKIAEDIPMNRFRPNLVVSGSLPFEEDRMKAFTINGIQFYGVKPCARCVITTINQDTASKGKEPLKTLATYRNKDNKIYFGENVITEGYGKISIGDEVSILETKESLFQQNI